MTRDEVEVAIRSAIHDSYRYGLGYGISVVEKFYERTSDPATFNVMLAELRSYSANLWIGQ